jgi:hypothetical protein
VSVARPTYSQPESSCLSSDDLDGYSHYLSPPLLQTSPPFYREDADKEIARAPLRPLDENTPDPAAFPDSAYGV